MVKSKDESVQEDTKKNVIPDTEPPKKCKTLSLFTIKLRGLPYKAKKKDVKEFLKPLKPKSIRVPPKVKSIAYAGFSTEKELKQALIKDRSFMRKSEV